METPQIAKQEGDCCEVCGRLIDPNDEEPYYRQLYTMISGYGDIRHCWDCFEVVGDRPCR